MTESNVPSYEDHSATDSFGRTMPIYEGSAGDPRNPRSTPVIGEEATLLEETDG